MKNKGSQSYLTEEQTEEVIAHLMQQTYRCSYEIIEYIWKHHDVRFFISGFNKWLHHHDGCHQVTKSTSDTARLSTKTQNPKAYVEAKPASN
jgi:hypothetical protein